MLVCSKALVMDRVLLPAAEVWWHGWSRLLQAEQQLCDTSVRPGAPALAPCKKPAKHPWVAQLPLHETSGFNRVSLVPAKEAAGTHALVCHWFTVMMLERQQGQWKVMPWIPEQEKRKPSLSSGMSALWEHGSSLSNAFVNEQQPIRNPTGLQGAESHSRTCGSAGGDGGICHGLVLNASCEIHAPVLADHDGSWVLRLRSRPQPGDAAAASPLMPLLCATVNSRRQGPGAGDGLLVLGVAEGWDLEDLPCTTELRGKAALAASTWSAAQASPSGYQARNPPPIPQTVMFQVISSLVFNGFSEDVSWNVNSTAELQKASTLRWPVGTCWADLAPAAAKMCPKPRAPLAQHKRSTQEKTSGFAKLDPGFDAAIRMCSHRTNTAKQKEGSLYGMCPGSAALGASPSSSCTTLVFLLAEEVSPERTRGCRGAAWALPVGTGEQHPGRVPQGHGLLPSAREGLSSSCVGGDSRPCAGEMLSHRNNGKRPEMN
ncbi:hypothetical protein Anapl_11312 [Anas platyrhynchos]|uniref:Uncharacterized protein n=1 Tax=Anas platyrhynchos TaxID=8839 RepID=R0JJ29_ANAPL|nr:hypothetical protein Anapl_11312 [Anas platyrhynchos]